ncbi:hypothetical protein [Limosilactobacillus reuteri]|nr:hypothetical protein [Limosilactobacillus reuteri]WPU43955.1 hypothetical protein SH603_07640 [Limosilactobacillus reuteri]
MDNDTRTLFNLTDPHLNFPHHWLKYKSMVDYRMKLATQLVVNKKRHSA